MSFYRREIRIGNALLLTEANGSWIRIDVLSLDGMRVQIGVDAPVDYPSRNAGRRNLVIGPIRVFVLKRKGQQKIQFGVRAPRSFSVVRNNGGVPESKQSEVRMKNTETNAPAPSEQGYKSEADTLAETDSPHGVRKSLVQENPRQRYGKSAEAAPLVLGPATSLEMQRLLSRNRYRLR